VPSTFFGLPVHPLVVHATVVIVPLTALALVLTVTLRRFRDWAGPLPLVLAVASVVLAPLSTSTGENLEHMVRQSPAVERHAELADSLIWFVLGMLVVAAASYFLRRRASVSRPLTAALLALGVVVAGATAVDIVMIGHSGAEAAWGKVARSGSASPESGG
jgi:uncharacterized membrane protein